MDKKKYTVVYSEHFKMNRNFCYVTHYSHIEVYEDELPNTLKTVFDDSVWFVFEGWLDSLPDCIINPQKSF